LLNYVVSAEELEENRNTTHKWHPYALVLYDDLQKALASIGVRRGIAGPVGRFFEAMVPRITGKTVTWDNAVKVLKQKRAEAAKVAAASGINARGELH
jgi:hypothetical protein